MKRTAEFVLGLLGGIFGFFGAFFGIFFGAIDKAVTGSSEISGLAVSAMLASIVAIVGSVMVRSKAKVGGAIMLIAAIWGLISISLFYVLPAVMLIIAGLMGVLRKDKQATEVSN